MKTTSGSLSLKSGSSSFPSSARATALELLRLVAMGAAAVALHAAARHRIELGPGHQGLWWIAMLLIGRLTSRQRWAGVTMAAGAAGATQLPIWHLGDPFLWLAFVLAGAVVDAGFGVFETRALWAMALLGGVAHATKPLIRIVLQLGGMRYASLLHGAAFPTATHFAFGAMGAFIGAALVASRTSSRTRNREPGTSNPDRGTMN